MLNTLASRIPQGQAGKLLGTVTAYPLGEKFQHEWDRLPPPSGIYHKQPYSSLAIALTASTGQPVRLFGERDLAEKERQRGDRMLLVSDAPLDHRLRSAVRAWERQVRGGPAEIELADLLPEPERARPLTDYIQYRTNAVPRAPGWVFRIATWQVMRRLAGCPLRVDGNRSQRLRLDTDGSLLAWDENDVLRGQSEDIFGMCRISAKLTTRAGVEDLVLTFDAHVSRFRTDWNYAKNTWLYRGDDKPVLRIPVRRRRNDDDTWTTYLPPDIEAVLEGCEPSAIEVGQQLPREPGDARPSTQSFHDHAVGSGQGPRYIARLHEHVQRRLSKLAELRYDYEPTIVIPERKEKAGGFPTVDIFSTGYQRILIVCLYATPSAHSRMLGELRAFADTDVAPVPGGDPVPVVEGVEVATRHCPDLLRHGVNNRAALLEDVLNLKPQDGRLTVAWVETEYHPEVQIKSGDAKPHLRRLLAKRGIPSQFLATDPPRIAKPRTKRQQDKKTESQAHSARNALRELFRLAGATGRHLRAPQGTEPGSHSLGRDALLVGIHARRQQTDREDTPLVLTMVAVHAREDASSWPTLMASTTTQDWRTAAQGITDFHAGGIGTSSLGRTEEKAARTRAHVDELLRKLVTGDRAGTPVVIFVDTAATRSIWPGLRDQSLGDAALPGDLLVDEGHDVAIVRLNDDVAEIGRPVSRLGGRRPKDHETPGSPGRKPKLYRLAESALPLWLFPRMSRVIDSPGGRVGTTATRWTLSAKDTKQLRKQLRKPWPAYTATEILVVRDGGFDPAALAALTARLCEHPVSWVGRTAFPVPLHLAVGADLDHPDYRAGS